MSNSKDFVRIDNPDETDYKKSERKTEIAPLLESKDQKLNHLKFAGLTDISICFFLKESFYFSINYFFLLIPILFSYFLYNMKDDQISIEIIGASYVLCECVFCLTIDFQEALGIVLGPIFSSGEYRKYSDYLWKMFLLFCIIMLLFMTSILYIPYLFRFIQVDESIWPDCKDFSTWYILYVIPLYSISNFTKGLIGIHQLQEYSVYVNGASMLAFSVLITLLLFNTDLTYYAFIFCYGVKFLLETILNIVIINKNSNFFDQFNPPSPCQDLLQA